MTLRFSPPAKMQGPRGAAPVGQMDELDAIELAAIVYLRSWCEGGVSKQIIQRDFQRAMGHAAAPKALATFDTLMTLALSASRRPIMRHSLQCRCFGGDESVFANLIAAAAQGDREDAMLFASTLLTGHAAFEAVRLAEALSQVFLRLARAAPKAPAPTHVASTVLHH